MGTGVELSAGSFSTGGCGRGGYRGSFEVAMGSPLELDWAIGIIMESVENAQAE